MKRNFVVVWLLILFFLPSISIIAKPIVDPNATPQFQPTIINAPNDFSIVNITNPNSQGISHNKYDSFNVWENESLIFNNSRSNGYSKLDPALLILANPNLSLIASTILNEITGANKSFLNGRFEIFGTRANLIFANPYGISINGASFLNTATLNFIAAKPSFINDKLNYTLNSSLDNNILIGTKGLDASDTQALNFFAKTITNNGYINSPKAEIASNISMVDLHSIDPNISANKIYVPQDSEGNIIGVQKDNLAIGTHNADQWEIKDGRIQFKAKTIINNDIVFNENDLQIKANSFENNGNVLALGNVLISSNDVNNNKSIESGNYLSIQTGTIHNKGSISSINDININANDKKTTTRTPGDQRRYQPGYEQSSETINYSIWNEGSINGEKALNLYGDNIRNSSAEIFTWGDMNITSNNLVNERIGMYTEIQEYKKTSHNWYNADVDRRHLKPHEYKYWIDRIGTEPEAYIGAIGNLNVQSKNTLNKSSVIEAGGDLSVKGDNYKNQQDILLIKQKDKWVRKSLFSNATREVEDEWSIASVGSSTVVGGNASFDLTDTFSNNGTVDVGGNLNIKAAKIKNGIFDDNIKTPPVDELPAIVSLEGLSFQDGKFSGINTQIQIDLQEIFFRNRYLSPDWNNAQDLLTELEENLQEAQMLDNSLKWGEKLTAEQIAKLTEPILWYEEGHYVVYVPEGYHRYVDPTGLLIANNINLDASEKVHNRGTIMALDTININAPEVENERRVANAYTYVKVYGGLLGGGSSFERVDYKELQPGGDIFADKININASNKFTNTGGRVGAEKTLNIIAPEIINQVQEGEEVVTWDVGNLGAMIGVQSYDIGSVWEAGSLTSSGDINLTGDKFLNKGSDVIAEGDINIKTKELIEQDWVASHNVISSSVDIGWDGINYETTTENRTRQSNIQSTGGNVNLITPEGTIKNNASNVIAEQNINAEAKNIEIKDDIHQSVSTQGSVKWGVSAPSTAYVSWGQTDYTVTTHESSNFQAGKDINLNAKDKLQITGSNIIAQGDANLNAKDIDISVGKYTDTSNSTGGSLSVSGTPSGATIGASGYTSESFSEVLTPTQITGQNVNINASEKASITASTIEAQDKLNITTPKLDITGEYQDAESETVGGGASVSVGPTGITGAGVGVSYASTTDKEYIESVLNGKEVNLNTGNKTLDGVIINGQEINPHEDIHESESYSANIGVGAGSLSLGGGIGDYSFGLSGGANSFGLSGGYKDYGLGTNFGKNSQGVFVSYKGLTGLGFNHSTTEGASSHDVWSVNGVFGVFSGGASFQENQYIGSAVLIGDEVLFSDIKNPFNYTCFTAGTPITLADGSQKNIEEIKIGDKVLSWDEKTNKIEAKLIEKTYIRKAEKILRISLSNKKILNTTPEHRFYVKSKGWIEAGKLNLDDKLLDENLKEVNIINFEYKEGETVYNLEVEDYHTYFANGILVHNKYDPEKGEEMVVLEIEVSKTIEETDINALDKSLNDLIEIIKTNPNLNNDIAQRDNIIKNLEEQRRLIQESGTITEKNKIAISLELTKAQSLQAHEALSSMHYFVIAKEQRALQETLQALRNEISKANNLTEAEKQKASVYLSLANLSSEISEASSELLKATVYLEGLILSVYGGAAIINNGGKALFTAIANLGTASVQTIKTLYQLTKIPGGRQLVSRLLANGFTTAIGEELALISSNPLVLDYYTSLLATGGGIEMAMSLITAGTMGAVLKNAENLIGTIYSKLGTVTKNPNIIIKDYDPHALLRMSERGIKKEFVEKIIANPLVVLEQAGGKKFLYLSPSGVVVIDSTGEVITTYKEINFDPDILQILKDVGVIK